MEIKEAEARDAREIAEELWLPLAKEMEELSSYNELGDGKVVEKSAEYRRKRLEEPDYTTFIGEEDGEKIGFVTVHDREHAPVFSKGTSGEISELFVKKDFRRLGFAGRLIDRAVEWCRNRGLEAVEISVDEENTAARNLYEEKGFKGIRRRLRRTDI